MPTAEAVPFHLWCFSGRFLINIHIWIRKANSLFVSEVRKGSPGCGFWRVSFWLPWTSLLGCGFSLLPVLSVTWTGWDFTTRFSLSSMWDHLSCAGTALPLKQEMGEKSPHLWHCPAFGQTPQHEAFAKHSISSAFFFFLDSTTAVLSWFSVGIWPLGNVVYCLEKKKKEEMLLHCTAEMIISFPSFIGAGSSCTTGMLSFSLCLLFIFLSSSWWGCHCLLEKGLAQASSATFLWGMC